MTRKSIVAIIPCSEYSTDCVVEAVEQAADLAELDNAFQNGKSILIKPNLLSARRPEDAVTTHPSVVHAVAQLAARRRCNAAIGDSPPLLGESRAGWDRLIKTTGMAQAAAEIGIEVKRFENGVAALDHPSGRLYKTFQVAEAVVKADVVVNVPKFKTHGLTVISGAVKNLFGCIPGVRKGLFHARAAEDRATFAQMLVDLALALNVRTHIMDAVVAMEGEGPNSGRPKFLGTLIASADPVALDAVAALIAGINPMSVYTIRLGHEQGLGNGELGSIEIRGAPLQSLRVGDFRLSSGANQWTNIPAPIRQVLRRQLLPTPVVSGKTCIGCGDCSRVCPVGAMSPGKPPSIDYLRCIRCYCCHEVCDTGAISLRRGLLGRTLVGLGRKR